MPKKTPKNAFYFFMVDFKEQQERKGVKFPNGMRDVADAASPYWTNMPPIEKGVYERRAKDHKIQNQYEDEKYTSQGVSYSELERRENEKKRQEELEQAEVHELIKQCYARRENMEEVEFIVIDVDLCCITTSKEYVPFEISLAKFCLGKGVTQVYHTFVNASIPPGYSFDARATAEKHGVTLPFELGEKDPTAILSHLMDFVDLEDQNRPCRYPFFTLSKKIDKVRGVLDWLCSFVDVDPDNFRVYDLGKMFFVLKNEIATNFKQSFPNESIAHAELAKDVFDFCKGLGCVTDEVNDTALHCTKSQVKRWAYIICDHCCKLVGIPLIPGKHIPDVVDVEGSAKLSRATSKMSDEHMRSDDMMVTSESRSTTQMSNHSTVGGRSSPVGAWGAIPVLSRSNSQVSDDSVSSGGATTGSTVNEQFAQLKVKSQAGRKGSNKSTSQTAKASYSSQVIGGAESGDFRRPYTNSGISRGLLFDSTSKEEFPILGYAKGRGNGGSSRGSKNDKTI